MEKSLSVDNIFVIAMIFSFFAVPALYQHRVLFWGILGALVMRGAMIGLGAKLIAEFHWILYLFAAFLILTAAQDALPQDRARRPQPEHRRAADAPAVPGHRPLPRRALRGPRRLRRVARDARSPAPTDVPDEVVDRARPGTLLLTPLALALIMVETTDLIFAVDSIPAIFAITGDPFLVFTSNVFAILGLRSLYFALAGMVEKFRYLKVALALVLLVVGFKMLFAAWLKVVLGQHFNVSCWRWCSPSWRRASPLAVGGSPNGPLTCPVAADR